MGFLKLLNKNPILPWTKALVYLEAGTGFCKGKFYSSYTEEPEMKHFLGYLDSLTNYEKSGVPKDAGTDSDDGLDLGRMRRLMDRLGNPQSKFKAVHIAGTKGKGSTAAFLSSILRAEGFSVGCYTSPHITTIRERISLGRSDDPVSAKTLNGLFQRIKPILDEAIHLESGRLTHFEILTATAFALMAAENVEIAVIEAGLGGARDATNVISSSELAASVITTIGAEHLAALGGSLESIAMAKAGIIKHGRPLILGGPFLPYIECILRDQALAMCSPVVSACDAGISCTTKSIDIINGRPCQLCDIVIKVERDFPMFVKLSDLKLRMLGCHQLQNATTAVCTALSLRNQGWNISDGAIKAGLENTCLLGRSQFLSEKEAEALGLHGATVLLDGAHTKESAKALVNMIRTTFPGAPMGLVVAMASDKDHLAFAKEFLDDRDIKLEAVFLTEANIAGGKSRTTPPSILKDCWIQASKASDIDALHDGASEYKKLFPGKGEEEEKIIFSAEKSLETAMREANRILRERAGAQSSLLVVTGSLHIVSLALEPLCR